MKLAFNNALRTTRSTFACSAKGGSASLLAKAFGAPKTMPKTIAQGARNTPLHIAREGLLDIKFRRQKPHWLCQRVEDNAFHLRALSERWIGFSARESFRSSEDDVTNTTV